MHLKNYYWYFKSALTPKFCNEVIKFALQKNDRVARVGSFDHNKFTDAQVLKLQKKRNSNLVWLDENWIYKEILPYVDIANKQAGWNFQWEKPEQCQFTKYKLNQHYSWHYDTLSKPVNGKIRKLSMTCQLTDGSEYKGGELEFDFRNYDPNMRDESEHKVQCKEILPKGSIIVFPSFVWHRVEPVTRGTRYSLVVWNLGKPFR